MTIALPSSPAPRDATPRFMLWGAEQEPPFGGAITQVVYPGSRFSLDVQLPPLTAAQGRVWVARLIAGKGDGDVSLKFPQPDFTPGGNANAAIKTAVSGGTTIALKGLAVGQTLVEGQFFSIVHSGRRYLHQKSGSATITADGSGEATITIEPPLRVGISVDDVVEIATPTIEGILVGNEQEWTLDVARHYGLAFSIKERE